MNHLYGEIVPPKYETPRTTMKKDDVYKRMFKAEETADIYREALEEMQVLLESARACNDIVYIGTLIQRLEHIVDKTLKQ